VASPDDLRKRLDALNRRPLPEQPKEAPREVPPELRRMRRQLEERRRQAPSPASPPDPILYRRDLPQPERGGPRPRLRGGRPVALADAVDGVELVGPCGGQSLLIETAVRGLEDRTAQLCDAFARTLSRPESNIRSWIAARCGVSDVAASDLLFVDLETTGLGSTPLFLIGTMAWDGDGLVVRQYFARTYAEEAATIGLFLRDAAARSLLVSFNGKSFDVPYVRVRAAANRVDYAEPTAHLDLLHVARRIWKGRLPDCRLQTLERVVCGRGRHGDIPGSEIPQAYHDFVRTGDARDMVECLKHNLLDLVTLADLMVRLPAPKQERTE